LLLNVYLVVEIPGIKAVEGHHGYGGSRPHGSRPFRNRFDVYKRTNAQRFSQERFPNRYARNESKDEPEHEADPFNLIEDTADEDEEELYCHWVNGLGYACIERCAYSIASQVVQSFTGKYIQIFNELCVEPARRPDALVGYHRSGTDDEITQKLVEASSRPQRLYVPLPFSFTRFTCRAEALVSHRYHGSGISVALAPLQRLIKVSSPEVTVVKAHDNVVLQASDLRLSLDLNYIFLDTTEREMFATNDFSTLFEQTQMVSATTRTGECSLNLDFSHLVKCLFFTVQTREAIDSNDTFDYSCYTDKDVDVAEPIQNVKLTTNGIIRFSSSGQHLRKIQPLQHFKSGPLTHPKNAVYAYSFGLSPAEEGSTGGLNFSRCDSAKANFRLHPSLQNREVVVTCYAFSLNMISYTKGTASISYA
jgi:hypothetical protein